MIRDLADVPGSTQELTADVLIIGGGIAGLLAASRLARTDRRVIVVESGGFAQLLETHPLNEVEQVGDVYRGAEHGRFRCLGGTSTRWGGAMLPFQATDMTVHCSGWTAEWPIRLDALLPYLGDVERLFAIGDGTYDFPEIMPGHFLGRRAKWPPFPLRNVSKVLQSEIRSPKGPEVWLNATATRFSFDPSGRVASVKTQNENGATLSVIAEEFVVAAGAIESTRLLLMADNQHDRRIFSPDRVLGRYFFDHLSVPLAKLIDVPSKKLNRVAGFGFEGAVMRNLRFEPTAELRVAKGISAGFVHIVPATSAPSGFDALREVYLKIQRQESPNVSNFAALARTTPWLARAVWWRLVERRLLFPDCAVFNVHFVTEQEPRVENNIGLSKNRVDAFGCPLASIDWRVNDDDVANVRVMAEAFVEAWSAGALSSLGRILMNSEDDLKRRLAEGGGIYHPGGSVRMGTDVTRGVVDSELRTFRVPNLCVFSTATFPTGGGTNPTMMLMMATLRAADRMALRLS
jgi:choline dehydrogenase-like flavoprotein